MNYVTTASSGTLLVRKVQSGHAGPAVAITTSTPTLWETVTESRENASSASTTPPASFVTVAKRVSTVMPVPQT